MGDGGGSRTVNLSNSNSAQKKDDITTVVDRVHNRSAQSDYVLALTLAAKVLKTKVGIDERNRGPYLGRRKNPQLPEIGNEEAMHCVHRYFLSQPIEHAEHLLFMITGNHC